MHWRPLCEIVDPRIFKDKNILIDERLPQNADFLILDISKLLSLCIATTDKKEEHFKQLCANLNLEVVSIESPSFCKQQTVGQTLNEDTWSTKRFYGLGDDCRVNVYRSGTASDKEYYQHDVVIKIEGLGSGCSNLVDGCVSIFSREKTYYSMKYKVHPNGGLYSS
ncbi:hypothetical protein ENBRE01_0260 [Enteropsectra breve]|nr:hypothetical protein ENBRE01_0260 [Enteropsectra breve]